MHCSLVVLALLSVVAAVPHHYTHHARHAALARAHVRAPVPLALAEPEPLPVVPKVIAKRKARRDSQKCKPRPTPVASSSSTSHSVAPSPPPAAVGGVANPGADPITTHTTTTTQAPPPPPPTTSASPAQAAPPPSSGNLPSYMTGQQTGQGTFYETGLGSCGITNTDSDHIVAVSMLLYDTYPGYTNVNPNNNPVCGRKIRASYKGNSVDVTVTDRCTGCKITDLDFSPSAFDILADPSIGRISGMTWDWIS
ncbi:hypothetical protein SISNIDRAFT_451833 [Sistotremastrum niveocremeum HHB9708]|uniref:RlpA-like protein double-psi beta-barrel domain-containing protein n=2 Tax=Sistotremastraceae TaxID=3402574 RepID=A0A164XN72_9AGAM|nr:hypothetical protein SISNIDRAFT_451833 [Sistotremastrum niveocremeum HHB9708]KZT44526.1 hypothetical protein SISSUDRAFT_1029181 [Sistotremastrum suecicum HHB10207 ss-3]